MEPWLYFLQCTLYHPPSSNLVPRLPGTSPASSESKCRKLPLHEVELALGCHDIATKLFDLKRLQPRENPRQETALPPRPAVWPPGSR
eukprot:3733984-Amphidinium_carterae.1